MRIGGTTVHHCLRFIIAVLLTGVAAIAQAGQNAGWYGGIGAGQFEPKDSPGRLTHGEGEGALMLDLGYRKSRYLRFELDAPFTEQDVDTPAGVSAGIFSTVRPRSDLSTVGVGGVVKFGYPYGRIEPYAGVGAGIYFSQLTVSGTLLGASATHEEEDTNLGEQLLAGLDIHMTDHWSVGAEFRRVYLKANFGELTNGKADIGGGTVLLTLRWLPDNAKR